MVQETSSGFLITDYCLPHVELRKPSLDREKYARRSKTSMVTYLNRTLTYPKIKVGTEPTIRIF